MQPGEEPSVLEISSSPNNKPDMAVTATEPPPEAAAAAEGVDGGDMSGGVDANNKSSEEEKGIKEGEGGEDEGEKINFGGNRWPRQETLALLKIRSDMDAVFRDSSLKGPLWEEVSRKLAELGYHRSAKKCKEKFENVYKYHKRTKESRSNKPEGKTYRFFDQLQALENQFTVSNYTPKSQPHLPTTTTNTITLLPTKPSDNSTTAISYVTTFPSTNNNNPTVISPPPPPPPQTNATTSPGNPSSQENYNNKNNNVPYSLAPNMNLFSTTSTSNSSTASDEDLEERYRKKRKWKDYFRRLTRRVLEKQEEMQKRFLDAIDKRERERVAQQDAWRMQEMARINREHEILVQEHSTAAAKDAAVLAFLQKLSGNPQNPIQQPQLQPSPLLPKSQVESQQLQPQPQQQQIQRPLPLKNGHSSGAIQVSSSSSSSSRWPKAEIQALIRLRTSLETKYQDNGPKAPLWEDISAGMLRLGYNRSAKRCKEKWENINKYFKKVKESNRQRREDSKTCPYFFELDALYKEKSKTTHNVMKPNEMMMEPLMVQPEQQWRPPPQYHEQQPLEEKEREEEEEGDDDDDGVEEGGDSVEDEGDNRYEIGTNKISAVDTVE